MSLWSRIRDLFRANAHSALDAAEDPVKMANEYIRQLEDQYNEAKRNTAEVMATSTRKVWRKTIGRGVIENSRRPPSGSVAAQACFCKSQPSSTTPVTSALGSSSGE